MAWFFGDNRISIKAFLPERWYTGETNIFVLQVIQTRRCDPKAPIAADRCFTTA